MIDTVTNLVEMQQVGTTSARNAAKAFEMNWLYKYPISPIVIHYQGTIEFMGENFPVLVHQQWGAHKESIN